MHFFGSVASYEKRKQIKVARISHINIHEVQKFITLLSSSLLSFFIYITISVTFVV